MVILYNFDSFQIPSDLSYYHPQKNYKSKRLNRVSISPRHKFKRLTSQNKKILLSLGFKIRKKNKTRKQKIKSDL